MKAPLLRATAHVLVQLGRVFGYKRAARIASALASSLGYAPRLDSTNVRRNLQQLFPDQGSEWLNRKCREVRENALRAKLFDKFVLPRLSPEDLADTLEWVNAETLFAALEARRGVVIVSLHYGRYWSVPVSLSQRGTKVFAFQASKGRLPAGDLTLSGGTLDANDLASPLRAVRALKAGGVVCIQLDTVDSRSLLEVEFLGHRTNVAPSSLQLADAGKALVVPMLAIMKDDERIRIEVFEPIDPTMSNASLAESLRKLLEPMEAQVRTDPGQWYGLANAHRRFTEAQRLDTNHTNKKS